MTESPMLGFIRRKAGLEGPLSEQQTMELQEGLAPNRVTVRALNVMRLVGCRNADDARAVGRNGFLGITGCGKTTMHDIGDAIGGWEDHRPVSPDPPPSLERLIAETLERVARDFHEIATLMHQLDIRRYRQAAGKGD